MKILFNFELKSIKDVNREENKNLKGVKLKSPWELFQNDMKKIKINDDNIDKLIENKNIIKKSNKDSKNKNKNKIPDLFFNDVSVNFKFKTKNINETKNIKNIHSLITNKNNSITEKQNIYNNKVKNIVNLKKNIFLNNFSPFLNSLVNKKIFLNKQNDNLKADKNNTIVTNKNLILNERKIDNFKQNTLISKVLKNNDFSIEKLDVKKHKQFFSEKPLIFRKIQVYNKEKNSIKNAGNNIKIDGYKLIDNKNDQYDMVLIDIKVSKKHTVYPSKIYPKINEKILISTIKKIQNIIPIIKNKKITDHDTATLKIKLSPPSLGELNIKIIYKDDKDLDLIIRATNNSTFEILNNNISHLKREIASLFQNINVNVELNDFKSNNEQFFSYNHIEYSENSYDLLNFKKNISSLSQNSGLNNKKKENVYII